MGMSFEHKEDLVGVGATENIDALREHRSTEGSIVHEFPEGGMKAWLTVLGGFIVLFCTFGSVQSFGVYQEYYTLNSLSDCTTSQISWIGSTQTAFLFLMGLPAGWLFDAGYFHHLMLSGSLIYVFSVFMLSLAKPHNYYQNFLAQGLGSGIGMGLIFFPAISVASHYFHRRRSFAMGLMYSGAGVGGIIYPIMLNKLFNGKAGYAWGVRATAFLDLGLLIIANLVMRTRFAGNRMDKRTLFVPFRNMAGDVGFWLCCLGAALIAWGIFIPYFYLQLFADLHGVPDSLAFYSISILNAASVIGRTIPNFMADQYGPFNVLIPASTIMGALVFALFGASNSGGVIAFGIFYGIFSGTYVALVAPAAAAFSVDVNEIGTRIGVSMFCSAFSLLTGSPIAGALLSPPQYLWWRPIVFASVVILAGCVVLAISRSFIARRKGSAWV